MARVSTGDLLLDIYHENQKTSRTSPIRTFVWAVTAGAALIGAWQVSPRLALVLALAGLAITGATLSKGTRAKAKLWLHDRQHRRRIARHRDELHRHVETLIAHTTAGSMDALPSILRQVDRDLLQKLKPASLTMHAHADGMSVGDTSRRDLPNRVRSLVWTVEDVNDRFFGAVIAQLREREVINPLKDHERKLVAEAFRCWDRYLGDLEAFIQTVNTEGNININPTFERHGLL